MIDVVTALLHQWSRLQVQYAVANGLEEYPRRLGRDVDVVVERRDLHAASDAVRSVSEERGCQVVVLRYGELIQHIAFGPGGRESLIIDLFPGLRWGPVWLVEHPSPSHEVDGYPVDPWIAFVKRVFLHVLVGSGAKFHERPERLRLSDLEHRAATTRLPRLVGTELARQLLSAVRQEDLAGLEALRPQLRRALVLSSIRDSPVLALRTAGQWAAARVRFATARPAMPTVTVLALDGVDSRPVLAALVGQAQDRLHCPQVTFRQRPVVLPGLGRRSSGTPSRGDAGSSRPPLMTLVRASYQALDAGLSRLLLDRRVSVDLGLVVYERAVADLHLDQLPDGRVSAWTMRVLQRSLPPSDLVVLLASDSGGPGAHDPALEETPSRHRPDLPAWLSGSGRIGQVLRVGGHPAAVAERIVDRLIALFVSKNGGGRP